ncbi:Zn-ribbon domain-containing OB-fold protein [Immundisolibacter sp.]|uniref:Zn-ribbon domain-containing OB-fold protein n=1 Tax=Immundisolibacter sp. TaxID=1934948 RepID=UPI003569E0D4
MYDITRIQGWPMPVLNELNRPHFDAMAEGKVLVQHCPDCATWLAPGAFLCENCGSTGVQWRQASGRGEIYSYVVMHRTFDPAFEAMVPYNVCLIELEEGPRLLANVVGVANADLTIGSPVQATFESVGEGLPLLKFKPA